MLGSKKEFSYKIVNDVQIASAEVVEGLDIKGLAKWLLNRYLSAFGFFPIKKILGEVTEHIQKILQRKNRRLLKKFYVTVVHVDPMDSLIVELSLRKERKLSPDTQGSLKSPRTVKKEKTILRTELTDRESRKRK